MTASIVNFSGIPEFHVELVRDRNIKYPLIHYTKTWNSAQAAAIFHQMLDKSPVEQMVVLYIDHQGYISGAEKVSIGGIGSVATDMKDLFRGAVVAGVPEIILGHNHTLNDVTPSDSDLQFTAVAIQAAGALNIKIVDHVIVSPFGSHYSIWDHQSEMATRTNIIALQNTLRELLLTDHPLVRPLIPEHSDSSGSMGEIPRNPIKKDIHDFSSISKLLLGTLKNRG